MAVNLTMAEISSSEVLCRWTISRERLDSLCILTCRPPAELQQLMWQPICEEDWRKRSHSSLNPSAILCISAEASYAFTNSRAFEFWLFGYPSSPFCCHLHGCCLGFASDCFRSCVQYLERGCLGSWIVTIHLEYLGDSVYKGA